MVCTTDDAAEGAKGANATRRAEDTIACACGCGGRFPRQDYEEGRSKRFFSPECKTLHYRRGHRTIKRHPKKSAKPEVAVMVRALKSLL